MELLPLHEHPTYKDACADVLNEEWPRSKSARLHMLEKSNDCLPYSMALIEHGATLPVIGHSRLCKVHGLEQACFVESVVVRKALRGKGYGRILMEKTERCAKRLGYTTMYLTTHDKQDFYGHLGYEFCDPVVSLGGASTLLSNEQLQRLFGSVLDKNRQSGATDGLKSKAQKDAENVLTKTMTNSDSLSNLHELTIDDSLAAGSRDEDVNVSTAVESHTIPLAPPLPIVIPPVEPVPLIALPSTAAGSPEKNAPPPPPPPDLQISSKTVTRLPQGQIYWMKKNLDV